MPTRIVDSRAAAAAIRIHYKKLELLARKRLVPATKLGRSWQFRMNITQMTMLVGDLTTRHGGRRVTPHPFRDIVAYTWLKSHPKDYLTLSKMLWHTDINTTIKTYGSRFNESSGVTAMETWQDERAASPK
jgi:integrase